MRIQVNQKPELQEMEVILNCAEENAAVRRIVEGIRQLDGSLTVTCRGETLRLELDRILYMETVDRRTFLYTEQQAYETDRRLYELEGCLRDKSFFRASRSTIINLRRVKALRPELGSRLLLTMDNGEKVVVSRQYAGRIKQVLGV